MTTFPALFHKYSNDVLKMGNDVGRGQIYDENGGVAENA